MPQSATAQQAIPGETVIRFVDPRGVTAVEVAPYELHADLTDATIGLLANGFPDSVNFLSEVQNALEPLLPEASFASYDKGNASQLATPEMLAEIAATCSAVILAYGH